MFTRFLPIPTPCVTFSDELDFYGEELLTPQTIPNLEDHPL